MESRSPALDTEDVPTDGKGADRAVEAGTGSTNSKDPTEAADEADSREAK